MAAPWEKYEQQDQPSGPWQSYADPQPTLTPTRRTAGTGKTGNRLKGGDEPFQPKPLVPFNPNVVGETANGVMASGLVPGIVGPILEKTLGPLLGASAGILPSFDRASENFQAAMGKARNIPINTAEPGNIALRAHELASHGTSLPKVFRDFTSLATKPDAPPITYEIGRDFASNSGRAAARELAKAAGRQTYSPAMLRQVTAFGKSLDNANAAAAEEAGAGSLYRSVMKEYRVAARVRDLADSAKKAAIGAAGLGTAYEVGKKLAGR